MALRKCLIVLPAFRINRCKAVFAVFYTVSISQALECILHTFTTERSMVNEKLSIPKICMHYVAIHDVTTTSMSTDVV